MLFISVVQRVLKRDSVEGTVLDSHTLQIVPHTEVPSVEVHGITKGVSTLLLKVFFEKEFGLGKVKNIEISPKTRTATIGFEDLEDKYLIQILTDFLHRSKVFHQYKC